jgi:predicted 3-demethylubiquinone-9 3-methyltransferase (glyoxalase superfamily)
MTFHKASEAAVVGFWKSQCESQQDIDEMWSKLSEGGEEGEALQAVLRSIGLNPALEPPQSIGHTSRS